MGTTVFSILAQAAIELIVVILNGRQSGGKRGSGRKSR